jgi:hypothetical protein
MKIFQTRLMLAAAAVLLMPVVSSADISISVDFAPPSYPVYEQPAAPAPQYAWAPGYWAYSNVDGYYWVPGTWVLAPTPGYLWTPCYWGWSGGRYVYHEGYWGSHVGFYGGINYGYGYGGKGYDGGSWNSGAFVNRSYSNQSNVTNVTNVTNRQNTNNTAANNPAGSAMSAASKPSAPTASFNGGPGGTTATPTAEEQAAAKEPRVPPTQEQKAHVQAASRNPALRASVNHGKPAIAATSKPGDFTGKGVVGAKQAGIDPHTQASKPQSANTGARPQAHDAKAEPVAASKAVAKKPQAPPKPKPRRNPKPKHSRG